MISFLKKLALVLCTFSCALCICDDETGRGRVVYVGVDGRTYVVDGTRMSLAEMRGQAGALYHQLGDLLPTLPGARGRVHRIVDDYHSHILVPRIHNEFRFIESEAAAVQREYGGGHFFNANNFTLAELDNFHRHVRDALDSYARQIELDRASGQPYRTESEIYARLDRLNLRLLQLRRTFLNFPTVIQNAAETINERLMTDGARSGMPCGLVVR